MRQKIYDFIVQYITEHRYPPTVREIADGVGLKSIQSVNYHIQKMLASGELETDHEQCPRAIRVPGYEFVRKETYYAHDIKR